MQFTTEQLLLGALSAMFVGISKTAVPGAIMFSVALMAQAFHGEAKLSVGSMIPLLVAGDVMALTLYHRHANWRKVLTLMPAVVVGFAAGAVFLQSMDDAVFRPLIGTLVLLMIVLELLRRRQSFDRLPSHWAFVYGSGCLAGFASMVGNVGAPIVGVYFLLQNLVKQRFMGTFAAFFLVGNLAKTLIYPTIGIINIKTLAISGVVLPFTLLGGLAGVWLLPRMSARLFSGLFLSLSALAAIRLIVVS